MSAHDVVMDGGLGDVWLWWLEHGLDGIGGGIVGGIAAGLVLRQTIRHERTLRENDAKDQKESQLQAECVAFVAKVTQRELEVLANTRERDLAWLAEVYQLSVMLEVHARLVAPVLADELDSLNRLITDLRGLNTPKPFDATRAMDWITGIAWLAREWAEAPGVAHPDHVKEVEAKVKGRTNNDGPDGDETSD